MINLQDLISAKKSGNKETKRRRYGLVKECTH